MSGSAVMRFVDAPLGCKFRFIDPIDMFAGRVWIKCSHSDLGLIAEYDSDRMIEAGCNQRVFKPAETEHQMRTLEIEVLHDSGEPLAGPMSREWMTLGELQDELMRWSRIAGYHTCVSFAHLCYGASSLWYETHIANWRKINREQRELSEFVLTRCGKVVEDFPKQVLDLLKDLAAKADAADRAAKSHTTGK